MMVNWDAVGIYPISFLEQKRFRIPKYLSPEKANPKLMKRINEKIKDIVEVRPYESLHDFIADPSKTLSAYHFTDITAEMMAKWLDRVVEVQSQTGQAKALAGYRGVGKSHFLATLGAIISHPELRSRITDPYVAASAQRLKRRRYPVAYVRRGVHQTLYHEVREAIARTFDHDVDSLPEGLAGIMEIASDLAGDVPFLLFIDTAFDRVARVSRDDGQTLDELAALGKKLNVFVGVALDDDIAGADGVNAAIASSYTIDYLDQEHLYRIIETNLLPKHRHTQHLLHEIYAGFREVLPSFRWSEQRFSALYPLHPVILETAPFVRLYEKHFTILDFAAQTGGKVLGRPANSLIGLDEVFDSVEASLRKSTELKDAFETYDKINAEVVAKIPIMQRLHAKLVLKGLLILSLNGDGTTASEISAAMLIYYENEPENTIRAVEDLLASFSAANPERVHKFEETGRETRYGLRITGKDNLFVALSEEAKSVSSDVFEKILRRYAKDRFPDWVLQVDEEIPTSDSSDCQISWRGGLRRGKIVWNWERRGGVDRLLTAEKNADFLDWEVIVCHPEDREIAAAARTEMPVVLWQPAPLRREEEETLRRYHVLLTNLQLREEFGEQVRAAGHTHHAQVEKIWRRIFIDEGKLSIEGFLHPFPDEVKHSQTLSELLTQMLMPLFELRYQQHPYFERVLGMGEVSQLVSEHFSGTKHTFSEVQELARIFAVPLGLVYEQNGHFVLETDERLAKKVFTREVLNLLGEDPEVTVSLKTIYQILKREPFGLSREAQHLVLSALVAQRCLEFVTSKGDRINRRSLDLKIIWDDIVGVAAPASQLYGSLELTKWAKTLTGVETFETIDNPSDTELVVHALETWLSDWREAQLLERFERLSDESINTKIWKLARHAQKTFGTVAITVEAVLERSISLEEGLQRIADSFSDSEDEFYACAQNLVILEDFISGLAQRESVWEYLALAEATDEPQIESLRVKLLDILDQVAESPSELLNRELESTWQSFFSQFSEHFAIKHDLIMKSHLLQEKFDQVMRSDEWWEFENLSHLPIFHPYFWDEAQRLCRQFKELDCGFDVKEMLKSHPFCACSFSLSQIAQWESLPARLTETIDKGRRSYRRTLMIMKQTLITLLQDFINASYDTEFNIAASNLITILDEKEVFRLLSNPELIILNKVLQFMPNSPMLQVTLPHDIGFQSREELQAQLNEWVIQLPSDPCLLKI
jgi:hypothetical protein